MIVDSKTGESASSAMLSEETLSPEAPKVTGQIARAASVIALGNITSRVLGLIREILKSHYFGAGGAVDALNVASAVPTMLYDLLVGGMVDSSMVPVFSEYAEMRREELWDLISALLSLSITLLAVCILIVELFAPQVVYLISGGSSPETQELATYLLRITTPAVLFLSLSGMLSALLYALKRFTFPAFAAAIYNAGMVLVTVLFHRQLDVASMAVGLLVGSVLQTGLQLSGLREIWRRLRFAFVHPGIRRIVVLFTPIALGLLVEILVSRPISYNLASQTGEGGISWMNYATYVRQLPIGLVAIAVSFAVLPTLSTHAAKVRNGGNPESFQMVLAQGIRLVMVLIVPASVGLFLLARPTIALLYEHGDFQAIDTEMTTLALQYYLLGLPFAAVDLLLVFAFYARQDTLTPSLIGVGTVIAYLGSAIILMPLMGLFSLMVADSLKQLLHMIVAGTILVRRLGKSGQYGLYRTLGLTLIASAAMGIGAILALRGIDRMLPEPGSLHRVLSVLVPSLLGIGIYVGLAKVFRVEEIELLWSAIRQRLLGISRRPATR